MMRNHVENMMEIWHLSAWGRLQPPHPPHRSDVFSSSCFMWFVVNVAPAWVLWHCEVQSSAIHLLLLWFCLSARRLYRLLSRSPPEVHLQSSTCHSCLPVLDCFLSLMHAGIKLIIQSLLRSFNLIAELQETETGSVRSRQGGVLECPGKLNAPSNTCSLCCSQHWQTVVYTNGYLYFSKTQSSQLWSQYTRLLLLFKTQGQMMLMRWKWIHGK